MIESDVEFQVDLIVERCAATNIFAGEQTMMNFGLVLLRDVLMLEGDSTQGAGKLPLNNYIIFCAADFL